MTLPAGIGKRSGKHHVGADTTFRDIERLIGYFGATKLLTEITDDDVAKLVAWRRGHRVTRHGKGKKKAKPRLSSRRPPSIAAQPKC